jgi:hypothetical protein
MYPSIEFKHTEAACRAAVQELSGERACGMEHGEIERLVAERGEEFMRGLMQDHADLRSEREKAALAPMRGEDGELRSEVRSSERKLGTVHGEITVRRLALVRHGVSGGLRPLDAHLNMPTGLYSHGVQREIAWGIAQGSYDTVIENLRRTTGATIAKRQVEELAVDVAADFESFYLEQVREPEDPRHLLVLTFDGAGVVMRPEALRPETRKKAAKVHRKRTVGESVAKRTPANDRPHRKRMAEVAAVYSLEPVSRTPEDVTRELRRTGPRRPRPKAQNKRVWASLEHPIIDVVDQAFAEASLRDEASTRRWVVLVDGNEEQLAAVERMAHNYAVEVTTVIDFIHVLGKLWEAGRGLLGEDAPVAEVEAWVDERGERILKGKSSLVAAGMRRSATRRGLKGKARKAVDACAGYLLKHRTRLRYHEYLHDGLPIATGVIEGACRSLVKDRMDITGARWGLPGGEAVLKLRALRASGDLEEYLAYHARQELERNHLSRFHDSELVELRRAA